MPTDTDAPKDAPEGEAPAAEDASPATEPGGDSLTASRIGRLSVEPDETLTASKPASPAMIDQSLAAAPPAIPAEIDPTLNASHDNVTLEKDALPPPARVAPLVPLSGRALKIRTALQRASKGIDARTPGFVRSVLRDWGARSFRLLDYLAVEDRRRLRSAIALAVAFNIIMFTALAVFGKFRIWIPSAPGDTLSIVMVELPQPFPELRDPEIVPEPEPEPEVAPEPEPEEIEEPEIVEEPELQPEPAPNPVPEPEPEAAPEPEPEPVLEPEPAPPEPEPDPEPELDLSPDEIFAPPAEVEEAPFIPEPETPAPVEEEPLIIEDESVQEEPAQEPAPAEEVVQSPVEEAPPLVEAEPQETSEPSTEIEVTAEKEEEEEEEGELAPAEEAAAEPPSGDDMFDEEPVFGAPRLPLPAVNLPEGALPATPGSSGVIAIFCPEEFTDKDKAAECAGRTEIRSGWRPGASGEDWSEAIRLLKQDRANGQVATDPSAIFGPEAARAMRDQQQLDQAQFPRAVDINDPAGEASRNLEDTLGQPDIGPGAANPNWNLREDPNVSQKKLRELEKALEDADKKNDPQ